LHNLIKLLPCAIADTRGAYGVKSLAKAKTKAVVDWHMMYEQGGDRQMKLDRTN